MRPPSSSEHFGLCCLPNNEAVDRLRGPAAAASAGSFGLESIVAQLVGYSSMQAAEWCRGKRSERCAPCANPGSHVADAHNCCSCHARLRTLGTSHFFFQVVQGSHGMEEAANTKAYCGYGGALQSLDANESGAILLSTAFDTQGDCRAYQCKRRSSGFGRGPVAHRVTVPMCNARSRHCGSTMTGRGSLQPDDSGSCSREVVESFVPRDCGYLRGVSRNSCLGLSVTFCGIVLSVLFGELTRYNVMDGRADKESRSG